MNTNQKNAIDVVHLTVGYGEKTVLEDISFSVAYGEIFVVLGGSGCGKSTLLKHMIGLYTPMSGDIWIESESIVRISPYKKRLMMQKFGVLYQSGALFGSLTVAENISLLLEEFTEMSRQEREHEIELKLAMVGLEGAGDYMPAALSGGMRKRAGLARALALNPRLLFFDEPSAGLDPITSAHLDQLILSLRERLGTTMVLVTHEIPSVFTVADRVILLDRETRGVIAEGNPWTLLKNNKNEKVQSFLTRSGTDRRQPHHPAGGHHG